MKHARLYTQGAAKLAFERCVHPEHIADRHGSYYKLVHYNYDYVEDFQDIFSDEGPRVCGGDDQGTQVNRKKRQRSENSQGSLILVILNTLSSGVHHSIVLKRMDTHPIIRRAPHKSAHTLRREEKRGDVMVYFQHHEPTAFPREPHRPWGPRKYRYHNHPLHLMV